MPILSTNSVKRIILVFVAAAVLNAGAHAQDEFLNNVGPNTSAINIPIPNGYINIGTGDLHLDFRLANHPQRGVKALNETLSYDSKIWVSQPSGATYYWEPNNVPNANAGWRFSSGYVAPGSPGSAGSPRVNQYVSGYTNPGCYNLVGNYNPDANEDFFTDSLLWTDPSGTVHYFDAYIYVHINECTGEEDDVTTPGYAVDGSGYYIGEDAYGEPTVVDASGNQIYPVPTDRYGNFWSVDGSGNLIDDTGRTPVVVNTSGSNTYYDVLGPSGTTSTRYRYTVTTGPVSVSTSLPTARGVNYTGTLYPVTNIALPDGSSYSFTYDSFGELSTMTLPTGGIITFGWATEMPDGTLFSVNQWPTSITYGTNPTTDPTYRITPASCSSSCTPQFTYTKPSGDTTSYTFAYNNGAWATHTNVRQSGASSDLLQTTNSFDFSNSCPSYICSGGSYLITKSSETTTYPATGESTTTQYGYQNAALNQVNLVKFWDFGLSPTLVPTMEKHFQYSGPDLTKVQLYDESLFGPTLRAETDYGYTTSAVSTSSLSLPNHNVVSGAVYPLNMQQWVATDPSHPLTTTYSYDDAGKLRSVTDPAGHTAASYTYQCADSLPHTVSNALSQTTTYGYIDCDSAAVHTVQDPNLQSITYAYETAAGRPYTISNPDGGVTTYSYPTSSPYTWVTTAVTATPSPTISTTDTVDAYGRSYLHTVGSATSKVTYDGNGRANCTWSPYYSTASATDGKACVSYDALDRPVLLVNKDLTTSATRSRSWAYTGGSTTALTDEAGNISIQKIDALGRQIESDEPTANGSTSSMITTTYQYSPLGLTEIDQSGPRTRQFSYDSLSRLTSITTPEAGTVTYIYPLVGSPSTCPGDVTLPCSMTDARNVTTTYSYDAINRLIGKTYTGPTGTAAATIANATPAVLYDYDTTASWDGVALTNTVGRLSHTKIGDPSNQSTWAERMYSYDSVGRAERVEDAPPSEAGTTYHETKLGYDVAGNVIDIWYPLGGTSSAPHIKQDWDSMGRLKKVYAVNGSTTTQTYLADSPDYYPTGAVHSFTLGNGVAQSVTQDGLGQLSSIIAALGGYSLMGRSYDYNPANGVSGGCSSGSNGEIWKITDTLSSNYTQYKYDCLNRLTAFSANGGTATNYSIDNFGNMSSVSGGSPVNTFDTHNRITNLPCASATTPYDAAGNQLCDTDPHGAARAYTYNAEGQQTAIAVTTGSPFAQYIYSAEGSRIRKQNGTNTNWTEYTNIGGQVLSEKDQSGNWTDYIYAYGQKIAKLTSFDHRIHVSGTTVTGGYELAVGVLAPPGIVVRSGDVIAWRQYNQGVVGGLNVSFVGGGSTAWHVMANDGQGINQDFVQGGWQYRAASLNDYVGATIDYLDVLKDVYTGPGTWSMYIGDISLVRADGTVIPIQSAVAGVQPNDPSYDTAFGAVSETISAGSDPVATAEYTTKYYLTDHVGTAQYELAPGGWPVWQGQFDPWGRDLSSYSTSFNYKYTGLEQDDEDGHHHAEAREYSSGQFDFTTGLDNGSGRGRWMRPDPYLGSMDLSNPQSFNRYAYVMNNPMAAVDPSGLWECILNGTHLSQYDNDYDGCIGAGGTDPEQAADCHGEPVCNTPPPPPLPPDFTQPPWDFEGDLDPTGGDLSFGAAGSAPNIDENPCGKLPGFDQFQHAAQVAISTWPVSSNPIPWLRGIFIHSTFTGLVSSFNNTYVNVAYHNGQRAGWLTLGSVRPDAVYGNVNSPNFIIELKTGSARLQNPQLSNYFQHLPNNTPICEIYESAR